MERHADEFTEHIERFTHAIERARLAIVGIVRPIFDAIACLDDLSWVEDPESCLTYAVKNELFEAAANLRDEITRRASA